MYRLFPSLTLIAYCAFGWFFTYLDDTYDQPFLYWAGMITYTVGIVVFLVTSFLMYKQYYSEKMRKLRKQRYVRIVKKLSIPEQAPNKVELFGG